MRRVTVYGQGVDPDPASLVIRSFSPLDSAIEAIRAHDGEVAVLASGDPGFFGIVRRLEEFSPVVKPGVSSVALAFARLGMSWDDAIVVSAHGRDPRRALNVCRVHPKVAVLTGPGCAPAEIRAALAGWERKIVVAQRLGLDGEKLSEEPPFEEPNVVLVLDPPRFRDAMGWIAGAPPGPARWARPEEDFAHRDSMITKMEVRALVLARLGPRLGDLVWDVGAGSGSVAAECARFGAAVIAVERGCTEAISRNVSGLGVRIVSGEAPAALAELPDPDAVFVGGGGLPVLSACVQRGPERLVVTVAAIERVGRFMEAMRGYVVEAVQLQAARLVPLPDGAHRLAAVNPVFVLSGIREDRCPAGSGPGPGFHCERDNDLHPGASGVRA
ncbi:MAG TPA: precorrin-6y C5,15-methyltransferase (decarboxylating) subunit CbiE [Candidatus Limnocylindrales bacterium]|nr:precorrin-6y C5,15-methyltransferase (decarboxylating) subunit CbiE [Candidatus Limnocylindrales bacterium]